MSRYHYLITGLPDIFFDGIKPPYSPLEFKEMSAEYLTKDDACLFDMQLLEIDNKNLLEQIKHHDYDLLEGGKFTFEEMDVLITGVQTELAGMESFTQDAGNKPYDINSRFRNRNKRMPAYFEEFVRMYITSVLRKDEITIPWEDRLSTMYYDYAMQTSNDFMTAWFTLNLNIKNIFTALTCRKYQLDKAKYIVGDNLVAEKLRTSDAPDFELDEASDDTLNEWLPALRGIIDESDMLQRQWKMDGLRWKWLDEQTFFNTFDIENIMAYWLKLEMLEYWSCLDKQKGEETFRQIMESMTVSSRHALEAFVLSTAAEKNY
jgi:hypothetical protein